jgi:hypothetical protein
MHRAIEVAARATGACLRATLAVACLAPAVAFAQLQAPVQLDPGEAPPSTEPPPPPPPPPSGGAVVPLGWDDPVFASVTSSGAVRLSGCETRSNLSIPVDGGQASVHGGCFTLNTSRIRSREAIRAAGGNITLNWVYAEADARAYPDDHADVLQCYGPGSRGDITVNNTTFRAFNDNATAGYFAADNWNGIHRFDNVLFWGGPFGLRLNYDGGDGVYMNNVYFVRGSFRNSAFLIDVPILEWNNVRWVTIENGKLVMGDPIPRP